MNSHGLIFTIEALLGLVLICGMIAAMTWIPTESNGHSEVRAHAFAAVSSYTHNITPANPPSTTQLVSCTRAAIISSNTISDSRDYCSD